MRPLAINHVELSLNTRWRSGVFLSLAAVVTLLGSAEAIRIAAASALGKAAEISSVQKAIRLDPANPALHSQLAMLYADSLEPANLAEAVQEAHRAASLNPHKSDSWLALASACESVRDGACADQSIQHALDLSPMAPRVWWTAGNHYLRTDQREAALSCFHRLLDLNPEYAAPAFDLTARAYSNPGMILDKVVGDAKDPRLELAFADFMSASGEFDAAHQAWTRIADGGAQFPFTTVQPYLERLLEHGRYQEAQAIWSYLEGRGIIAKPVDVDREQGNLVFNGGFEQAPLGAGFDWRSEASSYVSVDFADASPHDGARCLRVDFPVGQNDEFEPVYQIVPVVPNQAYTLAAYVRSRDITSDSGPRLRVTDPACPSCLNAATDTTIGSTPWHLVTLRFSSGPQTQAVRLSVWRPRSRSFPMEISGSFWLDDVSVRAEAQ